MTEIGGGLRKFNVQDVQSFEFLSRYCEHKSYHSEMRQRPPPPRRHETPAQLKACTNSVQNKITTPIHVLSSSSILEREIPSSGWTKIVQREHRVESLNLWDMRFIKILFGNAVPTSQKAYFVSITNIKYLVVLSCDKILFTHPVKTHAAANLEFPKLRKQLHGGKKTDKSPKWNHKLSKNYIFSSDDKAFCLQTLM